MASVLSVNLAVPRPNPAKETGVTGIDKQPVPGPVQVRAPGPRGTDGAVSGLAGDQIFDTRHHGGDHQAVYAYAREDLDHWQAELGRELPGGVFGENLTTVGVDVNGALIGEQWLIGDQLRLEVSAPRIPCGTFAHWMAEQRWIKRFTAAARPGAYLRVLAAGQVRAGDQVTVVARPEHDVTVALAFRAFTGEPELLARLGPATALPPEVREWIARRSGPPSPAETR